MITSFVRSGLISIGLVAVATLGGLANGQTVEQIKVLPDKAPDCTSLQSIVDSVTRGCKTNDEKAVAIYNFCMLTHYHLAYPGEKGLSALKEIQTYGWSLCGGLHSVESALWATAGWEYRFVGWSNPGHTTVEVKYDGRWHYLDVFLKYYEWMPDGKGGRTIAGQDDIAANPDQLIKKGLVFDKTRNVYYATDSQFILGDDGKANTSAIALLTCGDDTDGILSGVKSRSKAGSPTGWAGIDHATGSYSASVNLDPGVSLTNTWDPIESAWYWPSGKKAPEHTCGGHKDTRNDPAYGLILEPYVAGKRGRSYGSGHLMFQPDLTNAACLDGFVTKENVKWENSSLVPQESGKPAVVVVKLSSPYNMAKATGEVKDADSFEISVNNGKTYTKADAADFTAAVKGQVAALVKITFSKPLSALKLDAIVQNNPGSLPYLSPGKNKVTVSVADAKALGNNKLVVTYGYRLGSRSKSNEQLQQEDKEIAKGHNAQWADKVTVVQKTFQAGELPATFEIDCPTPKGAYAVYPRMMFLRREVISPSASPTPLPAGIDAIPAGPVGPDQQMPELPNPFLVGTELPKPVTPRATKTVELPLQYVQFCDETGRVADTGQLAWPKNAGEDGKVIKGAVLIAGDVKLPPMADIAAARLIVPVAAGHSQAPAKLGAYILSTQIEKGKAIDFKVISGGESGYAIIPQQPKETPTYTPAKPMAIDVTKAIKSAAESGSFHGLALRVVPSKGVDEGWTVRVTVSPTDKVILQVDQYTQPLPQAASIQN